MSSNNKKLSQEIAKAAVETGVEVIPAGAHVLKLGKILYSGWNSHRDQRVFRLLSNVGDEMNCGQSDEAWQNLQDKIDDPKIKTAILDAVRSAVDVFDESVIPYLANIVCLLITDKDASLDRRRLIRLLADCDSVTLETLRHMIINVYQQWNEDNDQGYVIANDINYKSEVALVQKGGLWGVSENRWPVEAMEYTSVFDMLKRNYLGSEGTSGTTGSRSGPNVIVLKRKSVQLLYEVLFRRVPAPLYKQRFGTAK